MWSYKIEDDRLSAMCMDGDKISLPLHIVSIWREVGTNTILYDRDKKHIATVRVPFSVIDACMAALKEKSKQKIQKIRETLVL